MQWPRYIALFLFTGVLACSWPARADKTFSKRSGSLSSTNRDDLDASAKSLVRILRQIGRFSLDGKAHVKTFKKLLDSAGPGNQFTIGQNGAHELLVAAKTEAKAPYKTEDLLNELYLNITDNQVTLSALGQPRRGTNLRLTLDVALDKSGAVSNFTAVTLPNARLSASAEAIIGNESLFSGESHVRMIMRYLLAGGPNSESKLIKKLGKFWVVTPAGNINTNHGYLRAYESKKLGGLPFFVAHDFGPKVLISKESGKRAVNRHEASDGEDDYVVLHGMLFGKTNGMLYRRDNGTGAPVSAYDELYGTADRYPSDPTEERTKQPGFVGLRDYRDRPGFDFVVGVDSQGLEYPMGLTGYSSRGFLPGTLRVGTGTNKLVGTLADDKLDHVLVFDPKPGPKPEDDKQEAMFISPQGFDPHTLRMDEELGIVVGEVGSAISPLITDHRSWYNSGHGSAFGIGYKFANILRNEAGVLIGEAKTEGEPYFRVIPEEKGRWSGVSAPEGGFVKTYVHHGSPFTVVVERTATKGPQWVKLVPGPNVKLEGDLERISFDTMQFQDFARKAGVFEGVLHDPKQNKKVVFHIDAFTGKVDLDIAASKKRPYGEGY